MNKAVVLVCLVWLAVAAPGGAAAAATAPEGAREGILQQELKQEQLRRSTQRLAEQLTGVIAEFENNGLSGEDLRTLKAIRVVLGRLSEKDMRQVLSLLTQARSAADAQTTKERLTGAYSGQQTVITVLKQLLLEYERQQALYELSIRFREMAGRQGRNMRAGVWLVRNSPQEQFNEEQKLALQVQQMDQLQIRTETAGLLGKLDGLAASTAGTTAGERPQAAARRAKELDLVGAMDLAADGLKNRKAFSATSNEKRARDALREVARVLLLSKDLRDMLRTALAETEAAVILQRQVIEDTLKIEKRDDGLLVEDRQFEVVDTTDLVRRDVQDIAPVATDHLRAAIDRMQEARELLVNWDGPEKKRRDTPPREREALSSLEQARRALQEQLARAEAEADKPEDTLARLKELENQVQHLASQQTQLKEQTTPPATKPQDLRAKAPAQGELKDSTQDALQQAADLAPAAAQPLSEAADQMDKAQKALARGQTGADNQQAAIDSLKTAERELDRQIAHLEQASKQLADLDQLSDKVGALIKGQQQVNLDTAKEAVKPAPSAPAGNDLARQESQLAQQSGSAQSEATRNAPSAAPHLGEAKARMNEAGGQLSKPDPKSAQAPEEKALAALFSAKQQIDRQIDDLRHELGQARPDSASSLGDATAALEKAQGEVHQAMSRLANAPPGLLEALTQQEQAIAEALTSQAAEDPSPTLDLARKAASQAAEQLGQGKLPQSVESMRQVQQRIQAAQAGPRNESADVRPAGQRPAQPAGQQTPSAEQDAPSLARLGQQQASVKEQAEALLAAQQAVPASAMNAAAADLTQAANDVAPVAAGDMGDLPLTAQTAVQSALRSLNKGAAHATGLQQAPAQANASAASEALAQALAALALEDAGLSSDMAQMNGAEQPGPSSQANQGKQSGKGQQAGQGNQPGQGRQAGTQVSSGTPSPQGTGKVGNWNGPGGANGPRRETAGSGQYLRLPARDRAALQQSRSENYPQEYGPLVEQYLKNLSDDSTRK